MTAEASNRGLANAVIPTYSTGPIYPSERGLVNRTVSSLRRTNLHIMASGVRKTLYAREPMTLKQMRQQLVPGSFFPDANTTGVYDPLALQVVTGNQTITTSNATFENKHYTGQTLGPATTGNSGASGSAFSHMVAAGNGSFSYVNMPLTGNSGNTGLRVTFDTANGLSYPRHTTAVTVTGTTTPTTVGGTSGTIALSWARLTDPNVASYEVSVAPGFGALSGFTVKGTVAQPGSGGTVTSTITGLSAGEYTVSVRAMP